MDASVRPAVHHRARRLITAAALVAVVAATAALLHPAPAVAATPAPVLFSDDFADGTRDGWRTAGGRWPVATDETPVLRQTSLAARTLARTGDPAWTDYAVTARVKQLTVRDRTATAAVLARVQPDSSHYYLATRADDTVEIGRVTGGRATPLATTAQPTAPGVWRSLTLVVKGSTLIGLVNGSPRLTATDTRLRAGRAGLGTTGATASFDDVLVQSYAAATPDTQAPLTPGRPVVTAVTPTTATATWRPTVDNVAVTGYVVYQGDQFYQQNPVRTVTGTGPVTLALNPAAASIHFAVAARDAAGNLSPVSERVTIPQPPTFPKSGTDTVPPTAPGNPVVSAPGVLTWAPATDDVGVVEYHVVLVTNIDEVRLLAKVREPVAAVTVSGSNPLVRVIAYDAAWNSASTPLVPYGPGGTPTPTPPVTPPAR